MRKRILASILGVALLATSAAGLVGCTSDVSDTVVFGINQSWDTLRIPDMLNASCHQVASQIYDKLVYIDESQEVSPRAAKSWEWSDDGMTLTFYLNEDAMWHDGEPVTAADWVFSAKFYATSEVTFSVGTGIGKYLNGVDYSTGIETDTDSADIVAVDDYTLQLNFSSAWNQTSFMTSALRSFYVIPQHCFLDDDGNQLSDEEIYNLTDYWNAPIGSGPYKYVSSITDSSITLEAMDDWYLSDLAYKNLIIQVIDSSTAGDKILSGDVDALGFSISVEVAETYENNDGITVLSESSPSTPVHICFNSSRIPYNIRAAVEYAINKEDVLEKYYGNNGYITDSVVHPDYPGSEGEHATYDVDEAKAYVDAAVEAGEWDTATDILKIGVVSSTSETIMKYVASYLYEVGIQTEVVYNEMTVIQSSMAADSGDEDSTYEYGCAVWTVSDSFYPTTMMAVYGYYGSSLFFRFTSGMSTTPAYCYLAMQTASADEELEIIDTFQDWEHENYPIVTLCYYSAYSVCSDKITGVDAFNAGNYNHATWLWEPAD